MRCSSCGTDNKDAAKNCKKCGTVLNVLPTIKCPSCGSDNKESSKNCKRCGALLNVTPLWSPSLQWHLKTLGIIYISLIGAYFFLNWFLKPYLRDIPKEVTPWLSEAGKIEK